MTPDETFEDWDERKEKVMLNGLRMKFEDETLRLLLLWTGDAKLIEASPADMYWGGLLPGSKNMLGNLLMQVREEIKKNGYTSYPEY